MVGHCQLVLTCLAGIRQLGSSTDKVVDFFLADCATLQGYDRHVEIFICTILEVTILMTMFAHFLLHTNL